MPTIKGFRSVEIEVCLADLFFSLKSGLLKRGGIPASSFINSEGVLLYQADEADHNGNYIREVPDTNEDAVKLVRIFNELLDYI